MNSTLDEFHFGYGHGRMDCRPATRETESALKRTWDGNDEMDPAQGRGWTIVRGDELHEEIFSHGGGGSEFVARKSQRPTER